MSPENGSTKVFLVRHGQSIWNGQQRVSGQLDPLLTSHGTQRARNIAQVLQAEMLFGIYTSSLTRSIETAKPTAVAQGCQIQIRNALKEIHMGDLQGRFRDQRDPDAQRLWEEREKDRLHYRLPGGETYLELEQRVIPCLDEIIQQGDGHAILIVGHRSTNRVIMARLMSWPREAAINLRLRSKYLYEILLDQPPMIKTIRIDDGQVGRLYNEFRM